MVFFLSTMNNNLQTEFGNIDIYLFDQLLKGRFDTCRKVIDIGCGNGRNIVYFLRNGYEVHGIDMAPEAISTVKELSANLAPGNAVENFVVSSVEDLPYEASSFDLAICSAVFHFASSPAHFEEMVKSVWRILKPGGYLFARLASDIGLESRMQSQGNGRYLMPDGTVRYLVNEQILQHYTNELNGELYEPIRTTNVNNIRCMTTWCLRKKHEPIF